MLRPTNFLRLFAGPIRTRTLQSAAPSVVLTRRLVATQTSPPTSTPQEPTITAATSPTPTTTSEAAQALTPSTNSPAPPTPSPEPKNALPLRHPRKRPALPYFVSRTPSNELPVYQVKKNSGKRTTRVKKVEGDWAKFRLALAEALNIEDPKDIKADPLKRIFTVQGTRKDEITKWLLEQGF
ncbi:hypothetical protein VTJ49DRAFT_7367 [Mycothermus thermophilus]|uniref:Large ribosomal subunit protein mL49 n=1 Tax=Humicola insolens TaxID=85995 RepID=A0ABR3VHX1_HUMIN